MKRYVLLLSVLCLLLPCLAGCGSSGGMMQSAKAADFAANESYSYYDAGYAEEMESLSLTAEDLAYGTSAPSESVNAGEKIIYSVSLSLESTEFDKTTASLDALVAEFKGYVQYSNVTGDTRYNSDGTSTVVNRYARYEIAVPVASFEAALSSAETFGNVTNKERSAENVTSQYTDIAARLESLRVQEERILALMEQSDDINGLITLEERLAEITYQKESYQRQMDNLERRIAYSTITVSVREVSTYTPTVPVTRTFGERLSDAFSDGWNSFVWGIQDFAVWFAESLPGLILFVLIAALIIWILILIVRRLRNPKKKMPVQTAGTGTLPTLADIESRRQGSTARNENEKK